MRFLIGCLLGSLVWTLSEAHAIRSDVKSVRLHGEINSSTDEPGVDDHYGGQPGSSLLCFAGAADVHPVDLDLEISFQLFNTPGTEIAPGVKRNR
jgi:hypothetical protein